MNRLRRALIVIAGAFAIGTAYTVVTHGTFEAQKYAMFAPVIALVVAAFGDALRTFTRRKTAGDVIVRIGAMFLLALPVVFVMSYPMTRFEVWRAQRYIETRLAPRLEDYRRQHGRYPARYRRLDEPPPADAPWLIDGFNYGSDGRTYHLWVMSPLVCGRTWSYSSATRRWSEDYDPCYY